VKCEKATEEDERIVIAIPPKPEEPLRHAIPSTGVKIPIMMLNIRWNCYKELKLA